jgi:hypothetical protein
LSDEGRDTLKTTLEQLQNALAEKEQAYAELHKERVAIELE